MDGFVTKKGKLNTLFSFVFSHFEIKTDYIYWYELLNMLDNSTTGLQRPPEWTWQF